MPKWLSMAPKVLPRGYLGYWEHFWLFWIFSKKNRKKIWNSILKNDPFWLKIGSFSTAFSYNSSRKSRKNLKSMSNESYDPGEHFWPPICMYRSTFVEVTAQKMSEFSIFAIFRRGGTWAFFWVLKNPKTQNTFRRSIFRQNFDFRFFRQNCPLESPEQLATIKKMFPACLGVENRFLKRYRIQFSNSGHI